jgi:hypothetical protein
MVKKVKIPRILMEHEYYKNLSGRAKVLYGILSEKKQQAEKYGWVDEQGSPYVIFPKRRMMEELSCSRYRLDLVTKELVATDLIELTYGNGSTLERRIYVRELKEDCPWIRVEYGARSKSPEVPETPVKDEGSRERTGAAVKKEKTEDTTEKDKRKEGTGSHPEKEYPGDISEKIDPAEILRQLMEMEIKDPAPEGIPLPVVIGALVSFLS